MNTLTVKEVAKLCRVTNQTIKRWFEKGKLEGFRNQEEQIRFWISDVKIFIREKGLRYPKRFEPSGFDCIELGC